MGRLRHLTALFFVVWVHQALAGVASPQPDVTYWVDHSGRATFEQARAQAEYRQVPQRQFLGLRADEAAWFRFSLPASLGTQRTYVAVPDARVDWATLFSPVDGQWSQANAGDMIAVRDWPVPHPYPVFPIAPTADGEVRYLRVQASDDLSTGIRFLSEPELYQLQQRSTLIDGLFLGLISMVSILALVGAFAFKDRAYAYLGAHTLLVNLAVAREVGIAGIHLWPQSPAWNDASEYVLALFCFGPLLAFVAVGASLRARTPRVYWAFCGFAVLACIAAWCAVMLPMPERRWLAATLTIAFTCIALAGTGWSWWLGDRFASWILLAFVPMLVALPFLVGRWMQLLVDSFLTQHAMQIGLGLTLPTMLLLLIVRSQERLDYRRRITRLEQHDPLTGLLNDRVFEHRLRGMIKRANRLQCDAAVLVIEASNLPAIADEFGRKAVLRVMLRLAGRLTATVRPIDTVARIGASRYAVLMEGPVPTERAAQLGSKFLARLILPFNGMPSGLTVRPRIAVLLVPSQASTFDAAMQRLESLLQEAPPEHAQSIFVAEAASQAAALVPG